MTDWLTYKSQYPWLCDPVVDKVEYNEGSSIVKSPVVSGGTPIWEVGKTGPAITDTHVPCGYWFKGGGYVAPGPISDPVLLLNFNGSNGDTTWTEEIQALLPDYIGGTCILDTSRYYTGVSSLKIAGGPPAGYADVDYIVPGIKPIFTYTMFFMIHDMDWWVDFVYMEGGSSWFEVYFYLYGGSTYLYLIGEDSAGHSYATYDELFSITYDVWHRLDVLTIGKDVIFKIDNTEVNRWTATIDNPMADLNYITWANGNTIAGNDMWIDYVSLCNNVI